MAINADRRDYKNAFYRHYTHYCNLDNKKSSTASLLLTYSVECGLKYLLMHNCRIQNYKQAQADTVMNLNTHDFRRLLKSLNQLGTYKFESIRTIHGDSVEPKNYHELCRYAVKLDEVNYRKASTYDMNLQKIVKWIGEVM